MKTPRIDSLYRSPVSKKDFEKGFLRQLSLPHDRDFLLTCFSLKDEVYTPKPNLETAEVVRLNKLAKAIKANRGFFKTGPLIGAGLLVVGLLVFSLFFMNPLIESAGEAALSSIFGARADISGLRFSLFGLRCTIISLTVADRDSPMKNLFETGRLAFRMNPAALLRGRVYIEEISAASLAFGTPRSISGALPDAPEEQAIPPESSGGAGLVDFSRFDAGALLAREKGNLSSTAAWENAGTAYRESSERWKARYESSLRSVDSLTASGKKVLSLDVASIKSPAEAAKAASDAKAVLEDARKVSKEAREVASGTQNDWNAALKLEKEATASVDKDFAYLKSFINPSSGAARSSLEPIVESILSDKGAAYLHYGERGLDALMTLSKDTPKKPEKKRVSKGRDVSFPSQLLPRFRLGRFYSSFNDGERDWVVDLREVSSHPALVGAPTTLKLEVKEGGTAVSLDGVADLRKAAVYSLKAKGKGLRFDLGNSLEKLGLDSFRGTAAFDLNLSGSFNAAPDSNATVHVTEPVMAEQKSVIGKAVADGIRKASSIDLAISYQKSGRFSMTSNLDTVVSGAIASAAAGYAKKAESEVNGALQGYVDKELKGKLGSKADLEKISGGAKGNASSSDAITKNLESRVKDLEAKAKKLGTGAIKGASLPKLR